MSDDLAARIAADEARAEAAKAALAELKRAYGQPSGAEPELDLLAAQDHRKRRLVELRPSDTTNREDPR